MGQVGGGDVERERFAAGDDPARGGGAHGTAGVLAGQRVDRVAPTGDGVADRAVAGAAAQVALEQACGLVVVGLEPEARDRGDQPGRAEPALERGGVDERLAYLRVEPGDRGDGSPGRPVRGDEAGVGGPAVEQDRARPGSRPSRTPSSPRRAPARAAGSAAPARLPARRPAGRRSPRTSCWSRCTCSASRSVMARRQSGAPCGSSYQSSTPSTAARSPADDGKAGKARRCGCVTPAVRVTTSPPVASRRPTTIAPERPCRVRATRRNAAGWARTSAGTSTELSTSPCPRDVVRTPVTREATGSRRSPSSGVHTTAVASRATANEVSAPAGKRQADVPPDRRPVPDLLRRHQRARTLLDQVLRTPARHRGQVGQRPQCARGGQREARGASFRPRASPGT